MALEERIISQAIETEMKTSYLDYAMSVIVSRALPDVRDGLKPVQRRILYGMSELGVRPDSPHKKSARIVGDVMGRYHPHGDVPIYESLVRMAQGWSFRYPLIDPQGNFGSVDGDPAGAMRYTEARLSRLAMELLADTEKDPVDRVPNYDEYEREPVMLPSKVPHLLMNGASGIAVGMATNIPPHNLGELVDGLVALIAAPELPVEDLLKIVKGPDFPTGGLILGRDGIKQAYTTGRGSMTVRAKVEIEELRGGKTAIIVTELPFMVNKAALIQRIADLVRQRKLNGVTDLRDESDRRGMRIVMELRRDVNPQIVRNQLFKHTQLQTTFGAIMLALVDGVPKVLTLRALLEHYLAHRRVVVIRRTRFDLAKAEQRAHILEGLKTALKFLDEVIALIRRAKDVDAARTGLMKQFKLSEVQANAILDLRLQRLTPPEREAETFEAEDLIPDVDVVITLTRNNYVKRLLLESYRLQRRGGKGVVGATPKEEDVVQHLIVTTNHAFLLFFTNKGKVYRIKAHEVPEAGRTARGLALVNLITVAQGGHVTAIIPLRWFEEYGFLFMATRRGYVKKTGLMECISAKRAGIFAITFEGAGELVGVRFIQADTEVVLATRVGRAIRFQAGQVREMGRTARGVKGIRARSGDGVVGLADTREGEALLTLTEHGFGKRTRFAQYPLKHRGGMGVINLKVTARTGRVAAVRPVNADDEILLISSRGEGLRTPVKDIPLMGRAGQGGHVTKLAAGGPPAAGGAPHQRGG